jgi:hypothetical protein
VAVLKHDQRACLAALWALSEGAELTKYCFPDADERQKKAVDVAATIGGRKFVVEHTLIESFEGQEDDRAAFRRIFRPLQEELSGQLPTPGHFELIVPGRGLSLLRPGRRYQSIARNFVMEKARTLQLRNDQADFSFVAHIARREPQEDPLELELRREEGRDGCFFVSRFSTPDIQPMRRESRVIAEAGGGEGAVAGKCVGSG